MGNSVPRLDHLAQHDLTWASRPRQVTEVPAWHARHQWDRARTSFSIRSTPGWRASTGLGKEVNNYMLISEWLDYVRQNWRKEEGQTMAE